MVPVASRIALPCAAGCRPPASPKPFMVHQYSYVVFAISVGCVRVRKSTPVYEKLITKKVLVLLRLGSGLGYELGLGLMLVVGLGLGFRVQRCADPVILGSLLATDSDQISVSASAAIRNSVSAVNPRMQVMSTPYTADHTHNPIRQFE